MPCLLEENVRKNYERILFGGGVVLFYFKT